MANLAVRSFAAGEIAPALYARADLARYEIGLRTCRNFLVMRQGGATKRPGTQFLTEVADSGKKVRLIPFVFNVRQSFVLEFGDLYVRFIQNGAQVADPDDTSQPLEIESPYAVADLADLQYVQSADVITLVHPSYPPYELERHSNTDWQINAVVFGPEFGAPGAPTVSGGDLATTREVAYVITRILENGEESLSSPQGTNPNPPSATAPVFLTAPVASASSIKIYRRDGAFGVFGFIAEVLGDFLTDYADFGAIPDIALQPPIDKPSDLFESEDNYPSVVGYYQQRLMFAGSNNNPDTVWASRTGYYKNFTKSAITQDDDAITFRIVSDEVDQVRHLLNLGRLVIGTEGSAWVVEGDGNGTLTPIAVNAKAGSYGGMGALKPIKSGANLLYLQAMGSAIRELEASTSAYGSVSLAGGDISIFSSHLVDGFGITDWAWQQEPLHVVWAVRSDGILLGLTYIPEQQVLAWHRHDTDGWVENVCVVPEGRYHWAYVCVRRLINGRYRRYIERMTTTNVNPLYATPEEALTAPGGVITPAPPPTTPPPSGEPVPPPTSPSTTDLTSLSATFNWIAGNLAAPTEVSYRVAGTTDDDWIETTLAGGLQTLTVTGLTAGTLYEWRARHNLSGTFSEYLLAPVFTASGDTPALTTPISAPSISNTVSGSGFSDVTISWAAAPLLASSELAIAGPSVDAPDESDFELVGTFSSAVVSAVDRIAASGVYWLRVRYVRDGFTSSEWAGPSSWAVSVVDEV